MREDNDPTGDHVRAYFSEFDRTTYSQYEMDADDVDRLHQEQIRKLKLLALIKGQVVIPASHVLESELARRFVCEHPAAVRRGIITVALRSDMANVRAFADSKLESTEASLYASEEVREVADFVDGEGAIIRWNANDAQRFFCERLVSDLLDENGVLGKGLNLFRDGLASEICRRIVETGVNSRTDIIAVSRKTAGDEVWWKRGVADVFCAYLDFLYYVAGATCVQAEGVLPQEQLIGYELAGERRGKRLSEYDIFFRIFMRLVRAHTQRGLPEEALEVLTLEEVADLRASVQHEEFVRKYTSVLERSKAIRTYQDPEGLLLHVEEMEQLERELRDSFDRTVAVEAAERARGKTNARRFGFLRSLLAFVPVVGTADDLGQVVANGIGAFAGDRFKERLGTLTGNAMRSLEDVVDRRPDAERDLLLAFLAKVSDRYTGYLVD